MANEYHNIHALPNGYRLHWYEIDEILGQGGFGITYLAHDVNLNQRVAIKEYLPVDVAGRVERNEVQPVAGGDHADTYGWGLKRFIKEAQTLARFKHPNIVAVNAVFEENNTAYMVMEYVEGEVFEDALREGRTMSEDYLLSLIFSIMAGVEEIHEAGFIHLDIKPDNIYLRQDGTPVLLDFGSARQAFGARSETLTALVSPGYAPYEQYDTNAADKQGPWTDIYALGATFYRAVTGRGPKDAMSRVHGILEGKERFKKSARLAAGRYSEQLLNAIDTALEFKPADRPQTIQAWRELLPAPPGFERREPEDDSGMDLLLIPDEEEETVVLSVPVIFESPPKEEEEEEETVVLTTPLIPESPLKEEDGEQETVVLDAPLVDTPSNSEDHEETLVLSAPLTPGSSNEQGEEGEFLSTLVEQPTGDHEETVVLGAPLADTPPNKGDEVIMSPSATEEASDIPPADTSPAPQSLDKLSPSAPVSPTELGGDEQTLILGAPVEPQAPTLGEPRADKGADSASESELPQDPKDPTKESASPGPSVGDGESERLPFETIRLQLAKQAGEETASQAVAAEDHKVVSKKSHAGLFRQIGLATLAIAVIAAMWLLLNPQSERSGFKVLSQEDRAALKAEREQKKQQEAAASQAADEDVTKASEEQAQEANLAEEQAQAEAAQQEAEEEALRKAKEQAEAEAEAAQRLAQQKAEEEALRKAKEQAEAEAAQRLAQQKAEEAQRLKEQNLAAEREQKLQIQALLAGFEEDLIALRLTSPAGNNALAKLQSILVLDPANSLVHDGFEAIVNRYVGLSEKSSAAGQYNQAQNYIDKAATVFADSPALATARESLTLLRNQEQARAAAEALAKQEQQAKVEEKARLEAEKRKVEALAAAEAANTAKSQLCVPRLLEPRPRSFPLVVSSVYSQPAFLHSPAPKIKWARYRFSSLINNKATEESISRYEIVDSDGVSTRVKKTHELIFDNGAGTARFEEQLSGEHVQILGGLISPVDVINADRETSITDKGLTNTTTTKKSTTTTLTRIYDILGSLFPLKIGNSFSYRSDARVVGKDGQVRSVTH